MCKLIFVFLHTDKFILTYIFLNWLLGCLGQVILRDRLLEVYESEELLDCFGESYSRKLINSIVLLD